MNSQQIGVREEAVRILDEWLVSCTRGRTVARNTVAVGIVVLDHLRRKCPVSSSDVLSKGGEIKGARAGLGETLKTYDVEPRYLKEVTTRQAPQDGQRLFKALEWGNLLVPLSAEERDELLLELIDILAEKAREWLRRRNLGLDLDRGHSPSAWIHLILERARDRSEGIVEQHLVGAKLDKRYEDIDVPNYPAHAADVQTGRPGDFEIQSTVYHVTATPSRLVIQKCAENARAGRHPLLLVPREKYSNACALAEDEGIKERVAIMAIEDFVALNIIEMASERAVDFFAVLQELVHVYNRRLEQVETDLSLRIELR